MNTQRIFALIKKDLKRTVREPALLFLLLLFPLMVTIAFGAAFGGIGTGGQTSFDIGVVNMDSYGEHPEWSQNLIGNLTDVNATVVIHFDNNETGQEQLIDGSLDALIVIPEGFGDSCHSYWLSPSNGSSWLNSTVELYVDSGSMIASATIPPLLQQVIIATMFGETAGSLQIPVEIGSPALIASSTLTQWDYMAPGIFAFAAIFLTMVVAQVMTTERDQGLLKRMSTTPVKSSEYMLSQTLSNMLIAVVQVVIIFAASFLIGYRPDTVIGGLAFAFLIATAFSLVCVGFGLVTATIAKSADTATGIAFIFIMPQMFFGTFMPMGGISEVIGRFMPSNYITHALTTLFLRGAPLTTISIWIDLVIVTLVGITVLLMGVFMFEKRGRK